MGSKERINSMEGLAGSPEGFEVGIVAGVEEAGMDSNQKVIVEK